MDNQNFDYTNDELFQALGFKCGLEIHQQLNTKKKLFCHCPVGLTNRRHDAEILRHMRPTLSELGEYDGTALMEFKTKKNVIYRLYRDRACTYEMDDTPPFLVNQEAVDIAIRIALLFNCKIVDEFHVARKQYLDGSIPTGFQRTIIIGIDGYMPYKDGQIKITQINLEEEACREISDKGHEIIFATDRLSTPLVEIITDADMKTPREAAEVCRMLGNAMKATGLVRRGIGTVRQDVNVSINGGDRVEIKGVYKVGNIPALTTSEAMRQKGLLEIRKIISERYKSPEEIRYREENFTTLFSETKNEIGRRLESDSPLKVVGLLLPRMTDITGYPLQKGRDFAFELSGRVKVIACIDIRPNLFFYSLRQDYDIPENLWDKIIDKLYPERSDDIVIICGPSEDVATAVNEIKIRIAELMQGVVNETRQDVKDGTTDFERILPGPDRMYPDTDHPPLKITVERVEECKARLSEPLWEKQKRWRGTGLHEEQVKALSLSRFSDLFDKFLKEYQDGKININLKKAAHILTNMCVGLRRKGYNLEGCRNVTLYEIIKSALRHDWPYPRLKSQLILIADGYEWTEASEPTMKETAFERAWPNIIESFNGSKNGEYKRKLRDYAAGILLQKYTDTHKVLRRIESQIAADS